MKFDHLSAWRLVLHLLNHDAKSPCRLHIDINCANIVPKLYFRETVIETINGMELLLIFKACLELQFEKSIVESPLSINRPGETKLILMLELYNGPQHFDILKLVGPFMRQLKRRHEAVLSSHFISFARGRDLSKLRVCYRCGDSFSMDEFDLPDLKSVVFNISTGAKVSPVITYYLSLILVPYYHLT